MSVRFENQLAPKSQKSESRKMSAASSNAMQSNKPTNDNGPEMLPTEIRSVSIELKFKPLTNSFDRARENPNNWLNNAIARR